MCKLTQPSGSKPKNVRIWLFKWFRNTSIKGKLMMPESLVSLTKSVRWWETSWKGKTRKELLPLRTLRTLWKEICWISARNWRRIVVRERKGLGRSIANFWRSTRRWEGSSVSCRKSTVTVSHNFTRCWGTSLRKWKKNWGRVAGTDRRWRKTFWCWSRESVIKLWRAPVNDRQQNHFIHLFVSNRLFQDSTAFLAHTHRYSSFLSLGHRSVDHALNYLILFRSLISVEWFSLWT